MDLPLYHQLYQYSIYILYHYLISLMSALHRLTIVSISIFIVGLTRGLMSGRSLCLGQQGRLVNLWLNLYCDCDESCTQTHSVMGCMWHSYEGTSLMPLRMSLLTIPSLLLSYDLL